LAARLVQVNDWLQKGGPPPEELRALQEEIRERVPAFHWMVEFPEVFYAERPDPLEDEEVNRAAFLDAFVGNPPFLGGKSISTNAGDEYSEWLAMLHQAGKNGDLSAHFFRRAHTLLGRHGTLGLIATNTIAQGDTRAAGLQVLVNNGHTIYAATRSLLWPGDASVAVSVVHTALGRPANQLGEFQLDGQTVEAINSRLRGKPERPDPTKLRANTGLSFQGSILVGTEGFTLKPEVRDELIVKDLRNADRIFPYIGGEEVNSSPTQEHSRYVISFGAMGLEEAGRWPDLLDRVRALVKPDRDKVKRKAHKKYWWHYGDKRPALYEAIQPLERCLVTARVTKHLCFSFQPTNRVMNEKLYVFPIDSYSPFACLQARLHIVWTWLLSSTMKNDLNYSATDCFETFPFPQPDPRQEIPELEEIGRKLYETRAAFMRETDQGLTQTYNLLKDPTCTDSAIEHLRDLHLQLDRAVLAAYGWSDIDVPPYTTPETEAESRALEAFEDEVIDRLFLLNAERAEREAVLGAGGGGGKKGGKGKGKQGTGDGRQGRLF